MTDITGPIPGADAPALTPAGLQSSRALTARRALVAALNLLSLAAILWAAATIFGAGGWSVADIVIVACVAIGAPWTVMGFWNAVIGLWLLHGPGGGGGAAASPFMGEPRAVPVRGRAALLMFLRNEPPARSFAKLAEMRRSLDATGEGGAFDIFILSDTDMEEIAAEEERLFAHHREALGGARAIYRRRARNTAWKAGNIRDWLRRWGRDYDFFLPLDSDSLMSGAAMTRMARVMEAHPRLGILQSLVVGAPAESFFARTFQFGMRHGMRSFTMGAAWWHGDCGPYWGHNALLRVAPFRAHCGLPKLPGSGPLSGFILSHDQIEAALMRRAGYEVRVLPVEGESWEENPPTLFDFTKRDLRWCQGNMQYWRLLFLRGLRPMSRFQIFAAMAMYFGAPAWMAMTLAAGAKVMERDAMDVDVAFAAAMFFIMFAVSLFPKIAGWLDVALRPGGVRAYGGGARFAAGALAEMVFTILMAPIVAFRVTVFMIGLAFGRTVTWSGQVRDAYRLSWRTAARGLWPQTLFGLGLGAGVAVMAPSAAPWAAPVLTGLIFAIPFAVATSHPALGAWAARRRLCAPPEEFAAPESLARIAEAPLLPTDPALARRAAAA